MNRKKEISKKLREYWRACNYEITDFGGMMLTPGYLHSTIVVEFGRIGDPIPLSMSKFVG
jgi:hypothetical protein